MSPMLAVVELPSINGIIADTVVNNFAIAGPTPATTDFAAVVGAVMGSVAGFYNAGVAPGPAGAYLSPGVSRVVNAPTIKLFDLTGFLGEGDDHGSPVAQMGFTLPTAAGATPLPHEVAVVLTLEGQGRSVAAVEIPDPTPEPRGEFDTRLAVTDRPKQRRTGRIFFGPLSTVTILDATDQARPSVDVRTALRNAGIKLDQDLKAVASIAGQMQLGVWSRRDEVVRPIEAVSTDDAFDTQRRRGVAPLARNRVLVA